MVAKMELSWKSQRNGGHFLNDSNGVLRFSIVSEGEPTWTPAGRAKYSHYVLLDWGNRSKIGAPASSSHMSVSDAKKHARSLLSPVS